MMDGIIIDRSDSFKPPSGDGIGYNMQCAHVSRNSDR